LGRTVEKYLRPNTKKGITKEQHITQPCFLGEQTVEKILLRPNTKRKESQKSSTSLNPCFQVGRTVEKNNFKTKQRKNHKRAAHH
jgi:hypothetical protein